MAMENKYRTLIVDDDPKIREINKKYMCKNGFALAMADNGQEAVELFRAGAKFDLVIMDMEMPFMNGPQATRELRAMGVQSLIIGMSTCTSKAKIEAFVKAGLDDYLPKPMSMAKVAAIVRRLNNK